MQATWYDLVSILPGDVVSEGSVAGYQQPITPSGTNMFSCRLSHTLIHTKYTKRSGEKIEIYLLIFFTFKTFRAFIELSLLVALVRPIAPLGRRVGILKLPWLCDDWKHDQAQGRIALPCAPTIDPPQSCSFRRYLMNI